MSHPIKRRKPISEPRKRFKAMVSTAHPLATQIGIDVLREGGNCVDAAIAVAAALNVVDMGNTGIGGDAFALVFFREEGHVTSLNASGRSPFDASIEEYKKTGHFAIPERGPLSVTTPGALGGWTMLHERYGAMPFAKLLQPAIKLANDGFEISAAISLFIGLSAQVIGRFPDTARVYLRPDGSYPMPGETLRQPELGASLELVAAQGSSAMYGGPLGKEISRFLKKNGGLLSEKDFAEHRMEWVEPIHTSYREYEVYTTPPNSQGLALLEMLNIMEGYDIKSLGSGSADLMHLQVEAKKAAFGDRNRFICDPDFHETPTSELLSKEYAEEARGRIDPKRASGTGPVRRPESGDTTYFCIVDSEGNMVSFINSLFELFGSGMIGGDTGIILQNRGRGFSFDPHHPNSLQPHKRPMHTLVPCIVLKESRPFLVLGCIGGDQQPQGLLQVLLNIIDFGMSPQEAIDAPRWRSYEGGKLALEAAVGTRVVHSLSARGHILTEEADFFGGCQCIMFEENGRLNGGSDPRLAGCWQGLT